MDKLCFSIDEERYDDRHGHVLSLVGWYMHPEKKKCIFQLLGDGYEVIDIPEIERYERPDVAQSLDVETEGFLPGFTVTIPEVLELRRKYDLLELLLLDGEEISGMSENRMAEIRNKTLGFVFQHADLLPELTALDNVALPLLYRGVRKKEQTDITEEQNRPSRTAGRCKSPR